MEFTEEQQEHVNSLVSGAKKKVKETLEKEFSEKLSAKDIELTSATTKITELEADVVKKTALSATDEEFRTAQVARFDNQEADMKSLREELAGEKEAAKAAKFDSSDKDALVSAGFDPKYIDDFLLPKIASARGVNDDKAFYKDSSGAEVDRDKIISSLVDSHPELVTINRAKGNEVAFGKGEADTGKAKFDSLLKKSQEGKLNPHETVQLSALANEMKQEKTE